MSDTLPLAGKTAVVTGASSGIGAEVARAMAAAGARVVLVGRDKERLGAVHQEITARGGTARPVAADLTAEDGPGEVVREALAAYETLDTLVHGAGLFEVGAADEGVAALDRQWALNVRAPYALTAAALPALRAARGSVVMITSVAAKAGLPGTTAYSATKGAMERLTVTLAVEEAPNGVRVNAIAPGHIRTPMNKDLLAEREYEADLEARTPLGRIGEPRDIAPLAVFLASDQASFITGESILVDGGWAAP
ncbi:SDR family NAD(P)-dependent oxidoreductase [Actinomadura chibensis]|uniref:Glucose 1-dehydrogenase n=1 Tax=Actinomadura chibensis TaxID=392828 RepID=A0A5D0N718_9ACTN|nr:glucose 1-dehydrogenase [Actinomadura chibensis]TYB40126.1 glucose 1-dehydrogenase [Actinomadura chibensis]